MRSAPLVRILRNLGNLEPYVIQKCLYNTRYNRCPIAIPEIIPNFVIMKTEVAVFFKLHVLKRKCIESFP